MFNAYRAYHLKHLSMIQRAWFLPLFAGLGVISWIATATYESPANNSGYRSSTHFMLIGEMPANTALRGTAQYDPMPGQRGCPYHRPQLRLDTHPSDLPQTFSFEVPLAWHLPDCTLLLSDVDFVTDGFYGAGYAQRSSTTSGAIAVRDALQKGVPGFPESGEKEYRGVCSWQTDTQTDKQHLQSLMTCHAANRQWKLIDNQRMPRRPGGAVSRNELAGKTIRMTFRMAEES
jgi:hypothetical protein